MMRVLDLFAGACGGWSLGLHRAGGFETVAACEADPWRRAVFSRNFPRAVMYDDVRTLTAERLHADGAFPDIIVGSPPCQDASAANHRGKGVDGERTGLFFEAVRLVGECRPRWACFENVPGIRKRGVDRVLHDLEALGYTVWPLVVGAVHVGANHKRARVWIIAHTDQGCSSRDGELDGQPVARCEGSACRGHVGGLGSEGWDASDAHQTGLAQREGFAGNDGAERSAAVRNCACPWDHWNGGAPDLGRVDDGLPKGMARASLAAYGDAVVPKIPELIGRFIREVGARASA